MVVQQEARRTTGAAGICPMDAEAMPHRVAPNSAEGIEASAPAASHLAQRRIKQARTDETHHAPSHGQTTRVLPVHYPWEQW